MYDETDPWERIEAGATRAVQDLRANPTDLTQQLARKAAAAGYEGAIMDAQADIEALWEQMESFEDFRSGLDELLKERLTAARKTYDRN